MKKSVAPRNFVEQRIPGYATSPEIIAKLLVHGKQRIDVIKRKGQPLAKVSGIVPASRRRVSRSVPIEYAIVQMAGFMDTEDAAPAPLGP